MVIRPEYLPGGIAKQRKEGSFRERKVPFAKGRFFSTKGRYQWGPGRYFMYLVILWRNLVNIGYFFKKKSRYTGIKGSVSFKEQTIIKQVPFAKGMFYTKGR